MSTKISYTKLFDEKEQSPEKITDTESNFKTPLFSAHADNINTNLLQDNHKPLPSPSLIQRNTKDPIDELSKLKNSEQITMKLFKSFCLKRHRKQQHITKNEIKTHGHYLPPQPNDYSSHSSETKLFTRNPIKIMEHVADATSTVSNLSHFHYDTIKKVQFKYNINF